MSKIFLYAEVQASVPFAQAPWRKFNPEMKKQPGQIRKTWLSGLETETVGGIYEFDTIDNARAYVQNYLFDEATGVGGAGSLPTRVYDGNVTEEASRDMQSPWLIPLTGKRAPGRVFMFNEMHWKAPFEQVPWRDLNPLLKQQPGLLTKQWISGVSTHTVNGFYEFDSKANALEFGYGMSAEESKKAGITSNIKLFDADVVEEASRDMESPYYLSIGSARPHPSEGGGCLLPADEPLQTLRANVSLVHKGILAAPHPQTIMQNSKSSLRQLWRSRYISLMQLRGVAEWWVARKNFRYVNKLWHEWSPEFSLPEAHLRSVKKTIKASMPAPVEMYRSGDFAGSPEKLATPRLLLMGDRDGCVTPAMAFGQEALFTGRYELRIVPKTGHFLHREAPDSIADQSCDWFDSILQKPPAGVSKG